MIGFGIEFGSKKTEHNATVTMDGKKLNVQVRSTGRGTILLREEPEHLIALNISNNGDIKLLYNGPGKNVWGIVSHQSRKQKAVSESQLSDAQFRIHKDLKLPIIENIFSNIGIHSEVTDLRI